MADRYPLVVNSSTSKIQELPAGGNLDLHNNGIVNAGVITATGFNGPIVTADISPTPSLISSNNVLLLDANSYSGSGNWLDTSGSNNHGTLFSTGSGLTYVNDGNADYFNFAVDGGSVQSYFKFSSRLFDPLNDHTFSIWVRFADLDAHSYQAFCSKWNAAGGLLYRYVDGQGLNLVRSNQSNKGYFSNSSGLLDETIYNFTFTRSGNTYTAYINGVNTNPITGNTIGTVTTSDSSFQEPNSIGVDFGGDDIEGRVYHVVAYSDALTASEVLQNYNALKERYGYGGMGDGKSNIVAGINTTASMRVGGDTSSSEDLVVTGNARVTGILTVGTSSLTITDRDINAAGVATCGNFKTGSSNVHSVGIEAAAINSLGADTPIGAGATIYNSGAAVFTGTVTAEGLEVDGNITVGGELTYNDVKSVDSIGIITARSNIVAQGNIIGDGATNISGMNNFTATTYNGSGANLTGIDATQIFTNNTSVQTVDTGSNGHVKFTTDGGERVRVSKDGAIGLGGANYGSSGQVIHSQGSGSAAVWSTFQGVPSGVIMMWSGAEGAIPSGWYLCNGQNSTPDLRNKFIVGAGSGSSYSVGNTGGANSVTLSTSQIPAHSHTTSNHSHNASVSDPGHGHSMSISDPGHSHNTSVTGAKLFPGNGGAHVPYGGAGGYPGTHFNMSNANTGVNMSASNANTGLSVSLGNANPSTNNTGGGGSHENRPPYYALCYIMKT